MTPNAHWFEDWLKEPMSALIGLSLRSTNAAHSSTEVTLSQTSNTWGAIMFWETPRTSWYFPVSIAEIVTSAEWERKKQNISDNAVGNEYYCGSNCKALLLIARPNGFMPRQCCIDAKHLAVVLRGNCVGSCNKVIILLQLEFGLDSSK